MDGYWTHDDYINLLDALDFPDAKDANPDDLRELLEMAINDFEPHESAEIILTYKLNEHLSRGQIQQLSHEMADADEAEEHADIALHLPLFNINQLLHKAYNGVFPNAKATAIDIELNIKGDEDLAVTKEIALKAICLGLSDQSLIPRLFEAQINGKAAFQDAAKVIWALHHLGKNKYTLITSDNWINKEDLIAEEFSGPVKRFEGKQTNTESG